MTITNLKIFPLNQNGYHKNMQTKERIGTLFIYPIDFTPDDCLSCDGYLLLPEDYEELYSVIGTKFKKSGDANGTFRVPDYNITGRFLQPSSNAGILVEAGLPNADATLTFGGYGSLTGTGAFKTRSGSTGYNASPQSNASGKATIDFSLSNANSIYGSSSTVQPPSQTVHVCIKYK